MRFKNEMLLFVGAVVAMSGCGAGTIDCASVQVSGSARDVTVSCDGKFMPCTAAGTNGRYTITCVQQMLGVCHVIGACMAKPMEGGGVPVAWIGQQPVKQSMYSQAVPTPECCLGVMADFGTGK